MGVGDAVVSADLVALISLWEVPTIVLKVFFLNNNLMLEIL
jgi:hypothetical protein